MLLVRSILLVQMVGFSLCRNMAVEAHQETMEIVDHLHQERMDMEEEMITAAEVVVVMAEVMGGEDQGMADHEEVVEHLPVNGAEEKDLREEVMMDREVVEVMMGHGAVEVEGTEAAMEETEVAMEEVDLISLSRGPPRGAELLWHTGGKVTSSIAELVYCY